MVVVIASLATAVETLTNTEVREVQILRSVFLILVWKSKHMYSHKTDERADMLTH